MGRVKATSILETVIAMAIILIVFAIAGLVFLNVSKAGASSTKIKATQVAENYFDAQYTEPDVIPSTFRQETTDFIMEGQIEWYKYNESAILVSVRISDKFKKAIIEQKRILKKEK